MIFIIVVLILEISVLVYKLGRSKLEYPYSKKKEIIEKIYVNTNPEERDKLANKKLWPILSKLKLGTTKEWELYIKTNDWNDKRIKKIMKRRVKEQMEWKKAFLEYGLFLDFDNVWPDNIGDIPKKEK